MKIITQGEKTITNNIHYSSSYRMVFLCISLAVWGSIPIIGIFLLLIFIQFNLLQISKPSESIARLNNLLLILVVFTVSIFFTSYTVHSDLKIYLQTYEDLGTLNPFEATSLYGTGTEFIPFSIAYLVYKISNGSTYIYLLAHALIINGLVILVISKRLSLKYYPAIIMVLLSTPFYYWQAIVMRHALSNVFLIASVTYIESSNILFVIYLFLSAFCHSSNFVNVAFLLFLKISPIIPSNFDITEKITIARINTIKSILLLIFILIVFLGFFYSGLSLAVIVPFFQIFGLSNYSLISLETRLNSYDAYSVDLGIDIVNQSFFILVQLTLFISFLRSRTTSFKSLALIIIYTLQFIAFMYGFMFPVNWRIYFLLISMHGLFYFPLMEKTSKNYAKLIFASSIVCIIIWNLTKFIRGMLEGWVVAPEHVFFDGRPLQMNLFDYIGFVFNFTLNK